MAAAVATPGTAAAWTLAAALVSDVCSREGARGVVIKGTLAYEHGLRSRRRSGDLDVIVGPEGFDRVVRRLLELGWRERARDEDELVFPSHATTLYRDGWPVDLDLHHRYKGFDLPVDEAFERLVGVSEPCALTAGLVAPRRPAHAVILALHCLRGLQIGHHRAEFDEVVTAMREMDVDELLDTARSLGALAAVRPALEMLDLGDRRPAWGVPDAEWAVLSSVSSAHERRALYLRRAGWRVRLALLVRWLTPDRGTLYKGHDLERRTLPRSVALYLRRLGRGAVLLPAALLNARR